MKQHSHITFRFGQTYSGGAVDVASGQKYFEINGKRLNAYIRYWIKYKFTFGEVVATAILPRPPRPCFWLA
jgi:hypothetical protein